MEAPADDIGEAAALEREADAAFWRGDVPQVIALQERAYRLYREDGDARGAGRVTVGLAWHHTTQASGLPVVEGWLARAHRLLDALDPVAEQGWLAVREASTVLPADAARARELCAGAGDLGRSLADVDLEVTALALEGLARVSLGEVAEGMRMLDEATAAAVAGEVGDWNAASLACCYLVYACERVRDVERAGSWCSLLAGRCRDVGEQHLLTVCRTHYASVLVSRGEWEAAEAELEAAGAELARRMPGHAPGALARLGDLRRRQGRLQEADALFTRGEPEPLAVLGRAEVALDQGRHADAADFADRVLRGLRPAGRIEAAPALEVRGRALAARGDSEGARVAAAELRRIADAAGTGPLERAALAELGARAPGDPVLSAREREVLALVGEGLSNAEIAARLVVSEHTVHRHVANILNKLRVSSRAAAVARAQRDGLLGH